MMLKKFKAGVLTIFMVGLLCFSVQAADPVKVMIIEPLSGRAGPIGLMAVDMFTFTADIINQKGGVLGGRKIEVLTFDNAMSPEKALQGLKKAIDQNIRFISQGIGSNITLALLKAVDKHNKRNPDKSILFLNSSSNATRLTEEDCSFWHFRFTQNTNMNAVALASVIAKDPWIKTVYMINQNYTSGKGFQAEFKKQLAKMTPNVKLVGDDMIPLFKTKDFTPYVAKIAASKADIVLTSAWGGDLVGMVRAINAAGIDIDVYTVFASIPNYIVGIGVEGVLKVKIKGLMNANDNDSSSPPEVSAWMKGYEKKHKLSPFTTAIKSTVDFFAAGLNKAGSDDPKAVAYAMEGLELPAPNNDTRIIRAADHQLLIPLAVTQIDKNVPNKILAWGKQLGVGWKTFDWASRKDITLPTKCKMKRPPR